MPLTSPIANLFSGSTKPQREGGSFGILDDGLSGAEEDFTGTKIGASSLGSTDIMAQKADEEEARRPYFHVSLSRTA